VLPFEHNCIGAGKVNSKMASKRWVAERVIGWLKKKSNLGTSELQDKLFETYEVEVGYNTVWKGKQLALD
jgi:hypothetical protein